MHGTVFFDNVETVFLLGIVDQDFLGLFRVVKVGFIQGEKGGDHISVWLRQTETGTRYLGDVLEEKR